MGADQVGRLQIDAVAINSSSIAIDTLPDTEYGSSTGRSEYFSKIDGFTRLKLT